MKKYLILPILLLASCTTKVDYKQVQTGGVKQIVMTSSFSAYEMECDSSKYIIVITSNGSGVGITKK